MLAVDACKEFKEFKETDVWVWVWRFFNVFDCSAGSACADAC
jgi:hypothetical protein